MWRPKNSKNSKKKVANRALQLPDESKDVIIGTMLIVFSLLTFFATTDVSATGSTPIVWSIMGDIWKWLFWNNFRFIFSPVAWLLGMLLVLHRSEWNPIKLIGLIGYFIALTSLVSCYQNRGYTAVDRNPVSIWFFDMYPSLEHTIGSSTSVIFLLAVLFMAIYALFQVSYRKILWHTYNHLSSIAENTVYTLKESKKTEQKPTSSQARNTSVNMSTIDKKSAKITAELKALQAKKEKNEGNMAKEEIPKWKQIAKEMIGNIFSQTKKFDPNEKKVPVHLENGDVILPKNIQKAEEWKPRSITTSSGSHSNWQFPSLSLLNLPKKKNPISREEIQEKALIIQKTLLQFGVEVDMEDECVWPTVIQYRLRPAEWVRISKIENLKKDLTLALSAKSIRIQAPIPGIGLIGIEVPNEKRDTVTIREVLANKNFTDHNSKLALALGKDINWDYIVWDLAKMPHLLIAGQTGSGKSVGMNGFILSLLYKNSPSELRMIMVDPKQVELGVYDGIPHLLTPVINTPDKALNALRWAVAEMERRLGIFKKVNARNLEEYNIKSPDSKEPVIVVIVDELADLMMSGNKKEVEAMITRIAQKARAAGIHLILATQRPSVDVITGLIKANVPSRVAFTVASQVDSRTILDSVWAEDLLGRWDMLYFPTWAMTTTRIQWVLVETEEVEKVVTHVRLTINPEDYPEQISNEELNGGWGSGNWEWWIGGAWNYDEDPKVIENAIALVRDAGKCSTSMLQRHLKLWYGRAARVVDILEEMWIVWPADGSKPREVL